MPAGLLNVLTRDEILDLVSFVEAGDDLPAALRHASPHRPERTSSEATSR
jgi:hypothetical protein